MTYTPSQQAALDAAAQLATVEDCFSQRQVRRVAQALQERDERIAALEGGVKEWRTTATTMIQQALKALWDDDPMVAYTASADGPGLVIQHFKKQRDAALADLREAMRALDPLVRMYPWSLEIRAAAELSGAALLARLREKYPELEKEAPHAG